MSRADIGARRAGRGGGPEPEGEKLLLFKRQGKVLATESPLAGQPPAPAAPRSRPTAPKPPPVTDLDPVWTAAIGEKGVTHSFSQRRTADLGLAALRHS